MIIDGYNVRSFITINGKRVPFDSLTEKEKIEAEIKMTKQMVAALGYEIKSMKIKKKAGEKE